MYFVWRRSDGYVDSTTYEPKPHGTTVFEILGQFEDWPTAHDLIVRERTRNLPDGTLHVHLTD